MAEAIKLVGKMLDAFPSARDGVRNSYIGNMAALLCKYPQIVARQCADPISGVVTRTKFLPTVADVVQWCEEQIVSARRAETFDRNSARQFRESDRFYEDKYEPPSRRAEVTKRIKEAMRARSFKFSEDAPAETSEEAKQILMQKYALSEEQFQALPSHRTTTTGTHPETGKSYSGADFDEVSRKHGRPIGPFEYGRERPYRGDDT